MDKVENARCIYVQKSSTQHTEKEMVRVVTMLEKYLDKLAKIVADVRDHKRVCDAECCLEQFTLFNLCRNSTMELMIAIAVWQQGFTRVLRPILMEKDYMIKLIKGADFYNGTMLRRIFNFSLGDRNLLFLPMPNPKTIESVAVSYELKEQIKEFAAPPIDKIIACYQMLINSLPKPIFSKILPLDFWLKNRWIPLINISSETKLVQSKHAAGMLKKNAGLSKKLEALKSAKESNGKLSLTDDWKKSTKGRKSVKSSKPVKASTVDSSTDSFGDFHLDSFEDKLLDDYDMEREVASPLAQEVEDDINRLSRLYVPKEKMSLLDAYYYDIDLVGSLSLTEGTSAIPPDSVDKQASDANDVATPVDAINESSLADLSILDGEFKAADQVENENDNDIGSIIVDDDVSLSTEASQLTSSIVGKEKEKPTEVIAPSTSIETKEVPKISEQITLNPITDKPTSSSLPKGGLKQSKKPAAEATKSVTIVVGPRSENKNADVNTEKNSAQLVKPSIKTALLSSESAPLVGTPAAALMKQRQQNKTVSIKLPENSGKKSPITNISSEVQFGAVSPLKQQQLPQQQSQRPRSGSPTIASLPSPSLKPSTTAVKSEPFIRPTVEQRAARLSISTSLFRQHHLEKLHLANPALVDDEEEEEDDVEGN